MPLRRKRGWLSDMPKRAQFWIGIFISLLCLGAVLWAVDLEQVLQSLKSADWRAVLFIAAGQVAFMLLRAWRWQLMLGKGVGYWSLFHAQNIGYLITNLLPFRLGDLARSYLAGLEPGVSGVQALSSVALERVLDMLIIVVFFGAAAPLAPTLPGGMGIVAAVICGAAVVSFLVMLLAAANRSRAMGLARWALEKVKRLDTPLWLGRVGSFLDGFNVLVHWRVLLPVMGLSLVLWLCIVSGYYGGLWGFWPGVTLPAALFTLCAAAFGVSAPSSPGFVGVFHGAVVLGLSVFPVTAGQALSFAVVYHATTYLVVLILGLVGLWQSGRSLGAIVTAVQKRSAG